MQRLFLFLCYLASSLSFGQDALEQILNRKNKQSVPYITIQDARALQLQNKAIFVDSREFDEYRVSHISNAIYVGYNDFKIENAIKKLPNKNALVLIYCSLGVRSEDVGEKLIKQGYNNVYNLYGGIFEWKNQGFEVFNEKNIKTDTIHAYSKTWGKWLKNGTKIYTFNAQKSLGSNDR